MITGLLMVVTGVSLYAGISHLALGSQRPFNPVHLLFSACCFCSAAISLFANQALQASTGPELLLATRLLISFAGAHYLFVVWFLAEYSRFRPLRWLYLLSAFSLLTIAVNQLLPYSLQFAEMPGIVRKEVWGETYSLPLAAPSPWFALGTVLLVLNLSFGFYALMRARRKQQGRLVLPMMFAVSLLVIGSVQGTGVRLGWIDFIPLGSLSYPAMMIVMSLVLRLELNQRVARVLSVLDHVPASVYAKDLDGRYVLTNNRFKAVHGLNGKRNVIGKTVFDIEPHDRATLWSQHDQMVITSGQVLENEFTQEVEGNVRTFRAVKFPLLDSQGITYGVGGISSDITDLRTADSRIQHLAHYDQLTGLANRVTLEAAFVETLAQAQQQQHGVGVMSVDLDHFKYINDSMGHLLGDQLLVAAAQRVQSMLRPQDLLVRMGGDDFVVLLPHIDAPACARLAEQLLIELAAPYQFDVREFSITASIGVAMYPTDGTDPGTLLSNADIALHQVKRATRNHVLFFDPSMQILTALTLRLSNDLKHALQRNQLTLHYQPQISLEDGRLVGAEALLRWTHPELGHISPAQFIPIAESNGLIVPIGEWVIRTAAMQAREWQIAGLPALLMAVNLSTVQFRHPRFIETVVGILAQSGLAARHLELDLTEAVAMDDPLAAIEVMDALHLHGVQMSIDDFGTGYSSLSYLKRFKVSKLKIDQSFVRDIHNDPDDQAIVTAIINLASSLGMQTIAEGVETAEQRSFLRSQGCGEAQGYFFSRPVPAKEFEVFARSQAAR